jgi:5-methylthioribose kinase
MGSCIPWLDDDNRDQRKGLMMVSNYCDLSTDRSLLRDTLIRLGLIQSSEFVRAEELSGGVSSTILKITTEHGAYCLKQPLPALKVAKLWNAPIERVYAEIAWLKLAASIVPGCTPSLLGVDEQTNSFVMSFLPPEEYPNWKTELLSGRVNPCFAASVAASLVKIHAGTADNENVRRAFSNDDSFFSLRLDPYLMETARCHPDLAEILRALVARTQSEKRVLVHGDVSPKNILVGAAGPIFLDAECACYGDPAFDVAFLLNHLLLKTVAKKTRLAALLEAFDAFINGYLPGVDWEPRSILEGRIASLLPALTLARISGKSPVEYLGPSTREDVVKVAAWLVAFPPETLEELKHVWKREFGI